MISAKGWRLKNIVIPTRPELSGLAARPGSPAIVGYLKKIHIVGETLAIGFTGDVALGERLVAGLLSRFHSSSTDKPSLQAALNSIGSSSSGSGEILGWYVAKSRPKLFHWTKSKPAEIRTPATPLVRGSGASHYRQSVSPFTGEFRTQHNAVDEAILAGLVKIGKIFLHEIHKGENIPHLYGLGAEMIFWDGRRFRYVEKYALTFWNIIIDDQNKLGIAPSNLVGTYQSTPDYSLLQVSYMADNPEKNNALMATKTHLQVISPLATISGRRPIESIQRLDHDATYFVTTFSVSNPTAGKNALLTTSSLSDDSERPLICRKGKMIEINLDMVRTMIPHELFST